MPLSEWKIGIAGLGGIAQHHLEGYRRRGLNVVAGAEPNSERRKTVQEKFGIPAVYATVEEMVRRDDVRIVDITVPHLMEIRRPVVEAAARAGKALFIQKPLMPKLPDAKTLLEIADAHGVPVMVNQNSLFVAGLRAAYDYLQEPRYLGTPYYCQIENRNWFDLSGHPWFAKDRRFITSDMGVHHYALIHHWFGEAESVYAVLLRDPSQTGCAGDNFSMVSVRFRNGVEAVVLNNWTYRGNARRPHPIEEVVVQGDKGTLTATSQSLSIVNADGNNIEKTYAETWFPDAFGASMAHYVECLDSGTPWWSEGHDNLKVIALIEAAYRSADERRVVRLDEIS